MVFKGNGKNLSAKEHITFDNADNMFITYKYQ